MNKRQVRGLGRRITRACKYGTFIFNSIDSSRHRAPGIHTIRYGNFIRLMSTNKNLKFWLKTFEISISVYD
jgi:hypothetical protein